MKFPNSVPNSDRAIDMILVTLVAIGIKALFPLMPATLLEIMGLTGAVGMYLLGQLRAIRKNYPYESAQVAVACIY